MRTLMRPLACAALLGVALGDLHAAQAADPPPPPAADTPADTATAPPPPHLELTRIEKPIPSPLHPRRRMMPGMSVGAGSYCPDWGSPSLNWGRWCTPLIRFAMDGPFSDTHLSLMFGDVLRAGALLGFDLGTPYIQLGTRRQRVALAVRGSFDLLVSALGQPIPGRYDDGLLAFSNTYGPRLSIALNPRLAMELTGAVGWSVGGFWDNHDGVGRAEYALVIESWLALRVSP